MQPERQREILGRSIEDILPIAGELPDDVPDLADDIVKTLREPLLVLDEQLRVYSASRAFYRVFHVEPAETIDRYIYELADGQWNIPELRKLLEELVAGNGRGGASFDDYQVEHDFPGIGPRTMLLNARRLQPGGTAKLILLAIDDITERRKTERTLAESARLLDLSNDAIIVRDVRNRITYWNHGAEEIFGWTVDQAIGQDLHTLLKTEFEAPFDQLIAKLCRESRLIGEVVQTAKDGRRITLLCRWSLDHDPQGNPGSILTTATDITARQQLTQASGRLAAIVESSEDAIISKDLEGIITSWNRGAQHLFGYTAQEAIGHPVTMLFPPDLLDDEPRILESIRRGERIEPYETIRLRKDGTRLDVSLTVSPIVDSQGRVVGASKIARDISERKRADEALRESDARYRAATAAVSDVIWTNNAEGLMEGEQRGWGEFTGQSREEYQGYGWSKAVHPEDAQATIDEWKRAVTQELTFVFEHRVRRHDGEWRVCSIRAVPVFNADSTIREWVGVHADITERKRAEEELKASEEFNRTVLESNPDCVKILDGEWRLQYMNSNGLCQLEIDDFTPYLNNPWEDLWGAENYKTVKHAVRKALQGETANFQAFCLTAKGTGKWWDVIVSPIPSEEGKPKRLISVSRDITERKATEEALRAAHDELELRVAVRTKELATMNTTLLAEISGRKIAEEQKIELLQRVGKTQEDERSRIARDLHDQMGQRLTALRIRLQAVFESYSENEDLRRELEELKDISKDLDADVEFLAWELRPTVLDELGLERALAEYVVEWSKRSKMKIVFHSLGFGKNRLAPHTETNLYRIAQEALNNATKYSHARSVNVLLQRTDDHVSLTIEDDGDGFDFSNNEIEQLPRTSLGLRGMSERANIIGGELQIETAVGNGTTVLVRAPTQFDL